MPILTDLASKHFTCHLTSLGWQQQQQQWQEETAAKQLQSIVHLSSTYTGPWGNRAVQQH